MLTGVTPLQLAQNGFYCQPRQGLGDLACCFAWKSAKRLDILKRAPFKEVQQIHLADCIWQVIYPDLENHFRNFLTATASPSLRQSTSSPHFPSDGEQPETTIAQFTIQSKPQSTPRVSTIVEKSSKANPNSRINLSLVILDPES